MIVLSCRRPLTHTFSLSLSLSHTLTHSAYCVLSIYLPTNLCLKRRGGRPLQYSANPERHSRHLAHYQIFVRPLLSVGAQSLAHGKDRGDGSAEIYLEISALLDETFAPEGPHQQRLPRRAGEEAVVSLDRRVLAVIEDVP